MGLRKHFFSVTVIMLLLLLVLASYYRFMITKDYLVSYEGECDPEIENCFVDCEDEECTSEYYYTIIEREAVEIEELCGTDILECEAANYCQDNVEICSITYCDLEIDGEACETINSN